MGIWFHLDKNLCELSGEGKLNFGTNFDLVNYGRCRKSIRKLPIQGKLEIKAIIGLDFYFSPEALKIMSDEIRMMPTLKPVKREFGIQ